MAEAPRVADWEPEVQTAESPPMVEWTGTRTRLPLARTIVRGGYDARGNPLDPKVLGDGDTIEVLADWDRSVGRWVGPEAEHVERLFADGCIKGSQRAEELKAEMTSVEHARGAWPSSGRDDPVREDFRQRDKEVVQREWERDLAGGLAELKRMESQERRADREENAGAIRYLADAIREGREQQAGEADPAEQLLQKLRGLPAEQLTAVLGQLTGGQGSEKGEFTGASAPGTHQTARRRRAQEAPDIPIGEEEP